MLENFSANVFKWFNLSRELELITHLTISTNGPNLRNLSLQKLHSVYRFKISRPGYFQTFTNVKGELINLTGVWDKQGETKTKR